jgi:hypothetical protein
MDAKAILIHEAKRKGMCAENYKALLGCEDRGQMIALYLKTIDWALEQNYPSYNILQEHFSDCEQQGIFVGRTFKGETFSRLQTYVFHHCSGTINVAMDYKHKIIPMLYFANDCHITINCKQQNSPAIRVPLYIFGDNTITTEDNANVIFGKYDMEVI